MDNMGARIKLLRVKAGLTQQQLGDLIGVNKSAVAKYEKGRVENLKKSSIKTIAAALGVLPGYLMFGEEGEENQPDLKVEPTVIASKTESGFSAEELELIAIFRELNTTGQAALIGTARGLRGNPDMKKDGALNDGEIFTA